MGRNSSFPVIAAFYALMAAIYVAIGVFFLWAEPERIRLPEAYKNGLGAVLVAYGLIRFWRTWRRYQRERSA